jgi:hypothetical protein
MYHSVSLSLQSVGVKGQLRQQFSIKLWEMRLHGFLKWPSYMFVSVVVGMADLTSAWEIGITCQSMYNLEHDFTRLLEKWSLVVEKFWCDIIWKRIIYNFVHRVPLAAHKRHKSFRNVFTVTTSNCNRQKLHIIERDVQSLLQEHTFMVEIQNWVMSNYYYKHMLCLYCDVYI